ncbi:hypothetical protein [Neorhizobium sp. DT-125]|uniref:hypothetical protein n=1 Tax=Neorhizobium sp. DT-125 TaxID=3396163 RepID=UPI003F1C0FED
MKRSMVRGPIKAILFLAGLVAYPAAAASQAVLGCAEHSQIVEFLSSNYAEKLSAAGLVNPKTIIEIYVGENGSWTLLVTNAGGLNCILLSGESWQTIPVLPGTRS